MNREVNHKNIVAQHFADIMLQRKVLIGVTIGSCHVHQCLLSHHAVYYTCSKFIQLTTKQSKMPLKYCLEPFTQQEAFW